jgi:hypothetical protein
MGGRFDNGSEERGPPDVRTRPEATPRPNERDRPAKPAKKAARASVAKPPPASKPSSSPSRSLQRSDSEREQKAAPAQPTRAQVRQSMAAVREQVRQCAGEQQGTARVRATARPSGRVSSALVQGQFAGTAEGSCIARAVREARLPPFSREQFVVEYPFQL